MGFYYRQNLLLGLLINESHLGLVIPRHQFRMSLLTSSSTVRDWLCDFDGVPFTRENMAHTTPRDDLGSIGQVMEHRCITIRL